MKLLTIQSLFARSSDSKLTLGLSCLQNKKTIINKIHKKKEKKKTMKYIRSMGSPLTDFGAFLIWAFVYLLLGEEKKRV